ncbi:hypothetical protein SAMN05421853_11483 [Roseivivax halotolerans]|uniref:Uncharacterized protein n=1 Tax=Roseivivax halotolerans TaxID=93684 RepID=A0A1I6A387_9RHOB|nr:hypothetical protein [Roseivivax halotolerans]SFQ63108.1 hypothetical protein SAMN05421853_11483 [Roseivivax halotolerans]
MASVSQLSDGIAYALDETPEKVGKYARALIDGGLLPKSRGRAVAQVGIVHYARLLTALALEPKIKEAAELTASYLALPIAGKTAEGDFVSGNKTAEDGLVGLFSLLLDDDPAPDATALRKRLCEGSVQFVRNFPLIEISYPHDLVGDEIIRFKPAGQRMDIDDAHIRRATIVGASLATLVAIKIDAANWKKVFDGGDDG